MKRRALALLLVTAGLLESCSKPKPPELTPRSAQVSAIRPDGVELLLALDTHNPNSFPIVASSVSGIFELRDGTELGRGESTDPFTLPAEGDATVTAKLDVRFSSLSALAPYALNLKPLPYRLRGTARLGGEHLNLDVPFSIEAELTPQQVLQAGMRGAGTLLQKP